MRETIKDLLRAIPGYSGYESKENRRDADKVLRTNLAMQYQSEVQALTRLAEKALENGKLGQVERIEGVTQDLNRFIARLESAPRGYAGWFSEVSIDEADLDQIYEFDARLADNVPLLREQIAFTHRQISGSEADFAEALEGLRAFVDGLHGQFDERQEFLARGKQH